MSRLSQRLRIEEKILNYEMPHVRIYDMYGSKPYAEGNFNTNGGKSYMLRACFGGLYPNEIPELLLIRPKFLRTYSGTFINDIGHNHSYHVNGKNGDGLIRICHTARTDWSPSMTAVAVFHKGVTWITAYEASLIRRKPLKYFVNP